MQLFAKTEEIKTCLNITLTEVDSHVLYKDLGNRNLILLKLWKPTGFHHIVLAIKRKEKTPTDDFSSSLKDDTSHPFLLIIQYYENPNGCLETWDSLVKAVCSSKSLCWKTAVCLNGFIWTDHTITRALLCKALRGIWDSLSIKGAGISPSSKLLSKTLFFSIWLSYSQIWNEYI